VILISGDRHRTDIWKTDRPNGYPLYEFLSAKVTNMHSHGSQEKKALWSYSGPNERFWGQLDFDTTAADPTVTFRAINHMGEDLVAFTLTLSQLNHEAAKEGEAKEPKIEIFAKPGK
jgi:alkaline phosphatase D